LLISGHEALHPPAFKKSPSRDDVTPSRNGVTPTRNGVTSSRTPNVLPKKEIGLFKYEACHHLAF
jgi:hypothetical protein